MATLLSTFEVKEIAFRWGGTTRVFRNNELSVLGEEDLEAWVTADKKKHHNFEGLWLQFEVSSPYLQRVSPSANAGNDWIDVKNAILDPAVEVQFFPIYSLDNTLNYVITPIAERNVQVLSVSRGMAYPQANVTFSTQSQLEEYPDWLRNTRYRG